MNIQNYLREEVKMLKAKEDISYKAIAENLLEMNKNAFYNWLHQYKNLSIKKVNKLMDFINTIK